MFCRMTYRKWGTVEPPLGALHLGPGTQDPQAGPGTRYLYVGLRTWDPLPGTRDPICGNHDPIPLRGTPDPYLRTLASIQLSRNVKFSSVAQLFQTGSCKNLYNMTEEQITQLKTNSLFTFLAFFRTYLKITNWHRSVQLICNKGGLCYWLF